MLQENLNNKGLCSNVEQNRHHIKKEFMITVTHVKYIKPLCVEITFCDGWVKTVDIGAYIKNHPSEQYNKYLDEKNFKKFKLENGNVVWGENWDLIFPVEALYSGDIESCRE